MLKSKKIQLFLVSVMLIAVMAGGTFAWVSISQRARNIFETNKLPNVNLHDDFDAPNKDVYVENSGDERIFVRVRLSEYMEIGGETLYQGSSRADANTWLAHNFTYGETMSGSGVYNFFPENCGEEFHDYYTWVMGGEKFYMPATDAERGNESTEPVVVQNETDYEALLRAHFADDSASLSRIDAFTNGTISQNDRILLQNNIAAIDKSEPNELFKIKMTLTAKVITMEQWINGDARTGVRAKTTGDFWVIDTDGWCYWANALEAGQATGLLLDEVNRTSERIESDHYYAIEAWLQAVTQDKDGGIMQFSEENQSFTSDARLLMELSTGDYVIGDDGKKYYVLKHNGKPNNAYREVFDDGGFGEIFCAGDAKTPGAAGAIFAGDEFSVTVPGEANPSLFNVRAVVIGENGKAYLLLVDNEGYTVYFGDKPNDGDGILLAPGSLFSDDVVLWPGAGQSIGTIYDHAVNPFVLGEGGQWYYNCGGNVFYAVESKLDPTPLRMRGDLPEYICAGNDLRIGTALDILPRENGLYIMRDGGNVQLNVNGSIIEALISNIERGADGRFYFRLAELKNGAYSPGEFYVDAGSDGNLGTWDDILKTSGVDGIIGTRYDEKKDLEALPNISAYGYDESDID